MKNKWFICVLAVFMLGSARALEDAQYISPEDSVYWHANASCQGELMLEADGAEGYFACPVCVQENVEPKITAVERGGTIILKMPDSWANSRDDIGSPFAASSTDVYEGDEALRMTAHYLHGDAYNAFMKSWEETGTAEDWVWYPDLYPENDELFMNERHIGGAWYVTMRPDKVSGSSIKIYLRFFGGMIKADGERLIADVWDDEWGDPHYKLKFSKKQNKSKSFSKDYGDFSIDIYDELDTHIAVIRQKNADKDLLEDVRLTVADQPDIILNGYMSGKEAVYCCTLTDGEDHLIRSGAAVKLWHEPWYTEENYEGTPYAVVQKGTGGYGVIDRDGNFLLGPGYDRAQRNGNTVFLKRESNDWEVINLNTMEMIAEFEYKNKEWIGIYPQNSAVFGVEIGGMWYLYENETGFPLAAMSVEDSNAPDYPTSGGLDGTYACYEIGYPQRLVFQRRDSAYEFHAWIADNHGNRASDNYTRVEPLIWNVDKGVYAIQTYTDFENVSFPNNINKFLEGFDGRPNYGEDWRVGLMDEDGKIIAPMDYVYIKVHSPAEIELHKEDGTVEWVRLG